MGVPGWPEFACWTASIESVRIVFTHSSSSVRWSVPTVIWLLCVDCVIGNYRSPGGSGRRVRRLRQRRIEGRSGLGGEIGPRARAPVNAARGSLPAADAALTADD